jgi:hypothetical protein
MVSDVRILNLADGTGDKLAQLDDKFKFRDCLIMFTA